MRREKYRVAERWTPPLARQFCPVSSSFLRLYHRLRPAAGVRGLNSTEAILIIHLMDHKWGEAAPFPAVETLAERMGVSDRAVRKVVARLEECGYIAREQIPGRSNRYRLDGLFSALEELLNEDASAVREAA